LTCNRRDPIEVPVVVNEGQPGSLGRRRNQEVGVSDGALMTPALRS
jgi:hypothetical protein